VPPEKVPFILRTRPRTRRAGWPKRVCMACCRNSTPRSKGIESKPQENTMRAPLARARPRARRSCGASRPARRTGPRSRRRRRRRPPPARCRRAGRGRRGAAPGRVWAIKACRLAASLLSVSSRGCRRARRARRARRPAWPRCARPWPSAGRCRPGTGSRYSTTRRPVKPVAPCTTMSAREDLEGPGPPRAARSDVTKVRDCGAGRRLRCRPGARARRLRVAGRRPRRPRRPGGGPGCRPRC
jgi:hypothetical protein